MKHVTRRLTMRRFGLLYGIKALGLRLQTTAFAVAALAVAVSMLIGITLMIGSFRRTVEIWINDTLRADIYVTTAGGHNKAENGPDAGALFRLNLGIKGMPEFLSCIGC